MNVRATLLAATASACLFIAACGGGAGDASSNASGSGSTGSTGSAGSTGGSGSTSTCAAPTQTSVVGGELFVDTQGLIGATLLSSPGSRFFEVQLGYSTCESNCSAPQSQDSFAFAFGLNPPLFNATTPVGTSFTLQPQSGIAINRQMVSTFPAGTPIFLTFRNSDEFGATAVHKDLGHTWPETALVTYGANSTATVDFRLSDGSLIRVGLTNVRGSSAGGC